MLTELIKRHWRKIAAGIIICLAAVILVVNNENESKENSTVATKTATVALTITGEVVRPGVYNVSVGSSVKDNMHLFGGFTMYADISKVDIDAPLTKDTAISVKARSSTDNRDYDSLYVIPE